MGVRRTGDDPRAVASGGEGGGVREPRDPARGAAALGVSFDDEQLNQFRRYGELLLATNEQMNLTAITEPSQVEALHFLDALTLIPAIRTWCSANATDDPTLIDVGSGAGVPGI